MTGLVVMSCLMLAQEALLDAVVGQQKMGACPLVPMRTSPGLIPAVERTPTQQREAFEPICTTSFGCCFGSLSNGNGEGC